MVGELSPAFSGNVLDYIACDVANVKSWLGGKSSLQVLTSVVVVQTGENRFPLREAVKAQLESLEDLPVLRLEDA